MNTIIKSSTVLKFAIATVFAVGIFMFLPVLTTGNFSFVQSAHACCGDGDGGGGGGTPPSCQLSASPATIQQGQSATLSWWSTNAIDASINQGIGSVPSTGSHVVSPQVTTTYTATFSGQNGSVTCSKTVTVTTPPPAPTCSMTASPANIQQGQSSTLTWGSTNATSATINQGIGSVAVNGSRSISPQVSTTYTGTFSGAGGTVTCSATVTVTTPPPAPTCSMSVNPNAILAGGSATLTWNSDHTVSASIDNGIGSVALDGSRTISPTHTTVYTGTFIAQNGQHVTCTASLTVSPQPPPPPNPSCTLNVSPATVQSGGDVVISWTTQNATVVSLTGFGTVELNGSRTDYNLTHNKTYTLTATGGPNRIAITCSKTVTVTNVPPPPPPPTCTLSGNHDTIVRGDAVVLTWTSSHANSATISSVGSIALNGSTTVYPQNTTTYTATFVGQNNQQVTCSDTVYVNEPVYNTPSCTIYISNNYDQYNYNTNQYDNHGRPVVITWTSSNANSGSINNGIDSVALNGSRTVYPTQSTVYTATFVGQNNQQVTCSVTVNINTYIPPLSNPPPYITLAAVPYTGLDLGPVGTAIYWGFLIAWCLFAAYLIAIKRIHMTLYRWYKKALFGEEVHIHAAVEPSFAGFSQSDLVKLAGMLRGVVEGPTTYAGYISPKTSVSEDAADNFITSQINRTRRS